MNFNIPSIIIRKITINKLESYARYIDDIISNEKEFDHKKYTSILKYLESTKNMSTDIASYASYIESTINNLFNRKIRKEKLQKIKNLYE